MSGEYLTMAEIEAKYPNEWVLIDRPRVDSHRRVLGGHVVSHSPERDHVERAVERLPRPYHVATRFTGPLDVGDEVYCL